MFWRRGGCWCCYPGWWWTVVGNEHLLEVLNGVLGQLVPDRVHKMEHLSRVLFSPVTPAVFCDVDCTFRSFDVFGSHAVSIQGRRLVAGSNCPRVHLPVEVRLIEKLPVVE